MGPFIMGKNQIWRRLRFTLLSLLVIGALAGVLYLYYLKKSQVPVKAGAVKRGGMLIPVAARARLQQAEGGVVMQDTQIKSDISQTRANLEKAEGDLHRIEDLHRGGYAS